MLPGRRGEVMLMGVRRPFVGEAGARSRASSSSGFEVEMADSALGGGGGASATGESGGGGMSVPAVRESSGARTGSSNLREGVVVVVVAAGIVVNGLLLRLWMWVLVVWGSSHAL
jgi:hypothetical protein